MKMGPLIVWDESNPQIALNTGASTDWKMTHYFTAYSWDSGHSWPFPRQKLFGKLYCIAFPTPSSSTNSSGYWNKNAHILNMHDISATGYKATNNRHCSFNSSRHSWSWSSGSWTYSYVCNRFLSAINVWVRIPLMAMCTRYKMWLATCRWFFQCTQVSFTNKTDRHDTTEIFLKVVLNTITLTHLKCKSWLRFVLLVSSCLRSVFVNLSTSYFFLPWICRGFFLLISVIFHHACHGTFWYN